MPTRSTITRDRVTVAVQDECHGAFRFRVRASHPDLATRAEKLGNDPASAAVDAVDAAEELGRLYRARFPEAALREALTDCFNDSGRVLLKAVEDELVLLVEARMAEAEECGS